MTTLGGRVSLEAAVPRMVERGIGIAAAFAREPREALERVREEIAEHREHKQQVPSSIPDANWIATLRQTLRDDARGEIDADAEFDEVWRGVQQAFAELNLPFGRGTFGGWDDGDPALARATWLTVRQLRPEVVVETGVGRGVTTRVILEAFARNGRGHLWSIDEPPLIQHGLADETGAVVPTVHRERWTLVRGSSRRRLKGLLAHVGSVDVFLHDSFHTARNLLFEWEAALRHLRRPGALLADDVHRNRALAEFSTAHPTLARIVGSHEDDRGLFAVLVART